MVNHNTLAKFMVQKGDLNELCQSLFIMKSPKQNYMELNQFIWNNYKESKEGQEVIKLFEEGYLEDIISKFVKDGSNKDLEQYLFIIDDIVNSSPLPENIKYKDFYPYILENGLKILDESEKEYDFGFGDF